jgi:hypothetical protein
MTKGSSDNNGKVALTVLVAWVCCPVPSQQFYVLVVYVTLQQKYAFEEVSRPLCDTVVIVVDRQHFANTRQTTRTFLSDQESMAHSSFSMPMGGLLHIAGDLYDIMDMYEAQDAEKTGVDKYSKMSPAVLYQELGLQGEQGFGGRSCSGGA